MLFKNLYIKFFSYFFIFSIFVVFFVFIINSSILKDNLKNIKKTTTEDYFRIQSYFLRNSINEAKFNIDILSKMKVFKDYIQNSNNQKDAEKLFYNFSASKKEILQLRYIDLEGNEKIRIQKYKFGSEIEIIKEDQLQNKKNRYYFKESISLDKHDYFLSNLDLNKEYGLVQKPYSPTLRISKPIFNDYDEKVGVLIANLDMSKYINILNEHESFYTYLIDSNGFFLIHPDKNKQWSKDLKTGYNFKKEVSETRFNNIIENTTYESDFIFSYSLENILNNNQGLRLVLIVKEEIIDDILIGSTIKLSIILIPILSLLGLVLAIYPSKIRKNLFKTLAINKEKEFIINNYVPIAVTDKNGTIKEINDAFIQLTGFRKDELVGFTHSKLKSGKLANSIYDDLWETIKDGKTWKGELENVKKNGQTYWIELIIEPKFNSKLDEMEYLSIAQNITDKKLTEKLAKTDHLTNLVNRAKIDEELDKALYSIKRYKENISIIMIDIDHFKIVNDKFGHNIGDSVLIEFSKVLKENVRKTDIVGRWGGEEFLIICPNSDAKAACALSKKIRAQVEKFEFKYVGNKTCSIGYTQLKQTDESFNDFVKRADEFLYIAKKNGRNRVLGDLAKSVVIEEDFSI